MRNDRELAEAVARRALELRAEKEKRKSRARSFLMAAACLALIIGAAVAMPGLLSDVSPASTTSGAYNATLFDNGAASGYVVIGVAAFALGVCFALLCLRMRGDR